MAGNSWLDRFPGLRELPEPLRGRLYAESRVVALPEGARIFGPDQTPASFLLLLKGAIRVQQVSETGREIVLYRVASGESCALTTACLIGQENYPAEGVAETPIEAVAISRTAFDELMASSPAFRRFVFTAFSGRIAGLFRLIEEIAFSRIDIRLAQKLLDRAGGLGEIAATHQQLATELGSAREVVSRQLHEFQRRGWVRSGRGTIAVTDRRALETLARSK